MRVFCLLVFFVGFAPRALANTEQIDLLVYEEHLTAVEELLIAYPKCYQAPLFEQPNIHLMELVLLCKAIFLGGLDFSFSPFPTPTQLRAVRSLEQAEYAIFGNSVWRYLESESVYVSHVLIAKNEYKKGIYTAKSNKAVLSTENLDQLRTFRGIVGRTWHLDRKVMDCFGLHQEYVQNYEQMIKMVGTERVDYILHNFGSHLDASFEEFGVKLYPIEGMKFSLPDSLHFFVSRAHPQGEKITLALLKGMDKLSHLGEIKRAYASIGFYNPYIDGWREYNCSTSGLSQSEVEKAE